MHISAHMQHATCTTALLAHIWRGERIKWHLLQVLHRENQLCSAPFNFGLQMEFAQAGL